MSRALVRYRFMSGTPSPVRRFLGDEALSSFGRWLRERVASAQVDFPAIAFHRVEITAQTLELVLLVSDRLPALVSTLAVAHPLGRELDRAARATGWTRGALFSEIEIHAEGSLEDESGGSEKRRHLRIARSQNIA